MCVIGILKSIGFIVRDNGLVGLRSNGKYTALMYEDGLRQTLNERLS